jgi:hypothetical protein
MDARKQRLGEHAAACAPPWAVNALGPVPAHQAARLDWQRRAATIAAWRELSGYHHPADPIGPEPAAAAPDLRAAWNEALAALGPADGPDVRGMPDGLLLHLRDTYPIETAGAPQDVGNELRQVRDAAWDARLTSLGAAADARAAQLRGDHRQAIRDQERACSYHALEQAYRQRETVFATVMADHAEWEPAPATSAQRAELTPDSGGAVHGNGPVDKGPGRGTPDVRRPARRPAEPDHPVRRPRLWRPGPGIPTLASPALEAILQPPMPEIPPSPQLLQHVMGYDADWEAAD